MQQRRSNCTDYRYQTTPACLWARSRAAPPRPCAPRANGCSPRRRRKIPTRTLRSTGGPKMGERREPNGEPSGEPREEHAWARELLGPYVLGALDPEEERAVERHLSGCPACQNEERGLRETHERLAGASIAASSASPDLKARILGVLLERGGARTSGGTARDDRRASPAGWIAAVAAAVLLILLPAALVTAYSVGLFDR